MNAHIEIETTCKTCGNTWTPDHIDYVRDTWRICSACREGMAQPVRDGPEHDIRPISPSIHETRLQRQ